MKKLRVRLLIEFEVMVVIRGVMRVREIIVRGRKLGTGW